MRKSLKMFIAGFLTCILLTMTVIVAVPADVEIKALLSNSITMKLFGKDFVPKAQDATFIKPITYKNRIYLPVKTVTDALGVPVEWDAAKKTLWIGGKITSVPVDDVKMYKDYSSTILTKDVEKLTTSSTTYKWGVANDKTLSSIYYGCYLKPEGKYKYFTASVFADGEMKYDTVLEFRKENGDGEVLKSFTLKPGETVDLCLDIGGVQNLYIFANIHGKITNLIIGEPTFRNDAPVMTAPAIN